MIAQTTIRAMIVRTIPPPEETCAAWVVESEVRFRGRALALVGREGRGGEHQAADTGSGRRYEGRGSPHLNRGNEPGSGSEVLSAGAPRSLNRSSARTGGPKTV